MRLFLVGLALLTLAGIIFAFVAWVRERAGKEPFPAGAADALLHPARRLIQPVASTIDAFRLQLGDVALELGPGPGYFTPTAARAVAPGGRLLCLDLQPDMLTRLRSRIAGAADNVDLVVADAQRLPLRDAVIDNAFLVSILGEVPDESLAVSELRRVIRPGGLLSFSETFRDPDYVREGALRDWCAAAGFDLVARRRQLLGYTARFRAARMSGGSM
ncbi:MAG: methyltransferase domain-containing protein [Dehalococcoidia bacterium]